MSGTANDAIYWSALASTMRERVLIDGSGQPTAFGDSITHYMTPIWTGIGNDNLPFTNIGFPGAMLQDLINYAVPLLASVKPSSAVIMIGINNALNAQNSDPPNFLDGLGVLIPAIRAYTGKISLATILPMEQGKTTISTASLVQPFIININGIIREAAANEGLPLLDTFAAFGGPDGYAVPGYTVDGVHPSAKGFAAIKPLYDSAIG